jgi:hypothetical protein
MTAWSLLTAHSTAPVGSSAWVHLNNQTGGTSNIIVGGMRSASMQLSLGANKLQALSTNAGKGLTANLINKQLTATINLNREAILCQ